MKQINFYKSVKETLQKNEALTENNLQLLKEKIDGVEKLLGFNNEDEADEDLSFNEFITNFCNKLISYTKEWHKYKIDKTSYIQNVNETLDGCVYGHVEAKETD